jgi:hypothetical protein
VELIPAKHSAGASDFGEYMRMLIEYQEVDTLSSNIAADLTRKNNTNTKLIDASKPMDTNLEGLLSTQSRKLLQTRWKGCGLFKEHLNFGEGAARRLGTLCCWSHVLLEAQLSPHRSFCGR